MHALETTRNRHFGKNRMVWVTGQQPAVSLKAFTVKGSIDCLLKSFAHAGCTGI
jgi:hypothetical protein